MQLNILNFPKRAIDRICDFVDRTTLQRIYITSSCDRRYASLMLHFKNIRSYCIWKFCTISIFTKLNILNLSYEQIGTDKVICLRIKKGDVVLLFNLLHSLLCNAVIKELEIPQEKSTFINMIFRILEDNLIEKIGVFSEKIDFAVWLGFVEKVKPISFQCHLRSITKESTEFLCKLADLVDEIEISRLNKCSKFIMVSISIEMLSRKCKKLSLIEERYMPISSREIEKLIQVFHHFEKRIYFSAWTDLRLGATQVGSYRMETENIFNVVLRTYITDVDNYDSD